MNLPQYLRVPNSELVLLFKNRVFHSKIVSVYDQEIPQSQTADKHVAS